MFSRAVYVIIALASLFVAAACGGTSTDHIPAFARASSVPPQPALPIPVLPLLAVPALPQNDARRPLATQHNAFFGGESALSNGVYYLQFPSSNPFGYYSYLPDQHYVYHFDLGYEYVFDSTDPNAVYLYDFASGHFWYTGANLFPYVYDFALKSFLFYYPDTKNAGHYTTNPRYFFNYQTAQIVTVPATSPLPTPSPVPTAIIINAAGVYTGSWQSLDPKTPAVTINTTAPVVLQNCTITSKSDLIRAVLPNTHVTITNCRGYGLDPGVAGQLRGSFFAVYEPGSVVMEHNTIQATSFGLSTASVDGWVAGGPFTIRYNLAVNLDGAASDGAGGRDLSHFKFGQDNGNHFAILATLQNLPGADISWNEIDTAPPPSLDSIGDVINIYSSSGTAALPINIHDNFIDGGYPGNPTSTTYYGGGIITDGRSTDTAANATAHVKIYNNQIVGHSDYSIGIAAGHDNEAYGNRAVATGQYANGAWYFGYAAISIVNSYHTPATTFFNNVAHDNIAGIQFEFAYPATPTVFSPPVITFQNYVFPDCAGGATAPGSLCTNNVAIPPPITAATEANERALWQQKLTANNVAVGAQSFARAPGALPATR